MSVFVTQLVPKGKEKSFLGISQAAMNFCHNFISATKPDFIYALHHISEIKKAKFKFEYSNLCFVQIRIFPHNKISRFINALIENLIIVIRVISRRQNNIWFYNINAHNFIAYFTLKYFALKKCFVIFADFDPSLKINMVTLPLIKSADGIISFSDKAHELFGSHKNLYIKSGIIDSNISDCEIQTYTNKKRCLFAGSLNPHAGIELALRAFACIPDMELLITGEGRGEKMIREYAHQFGNIKYLGFLEYSEYLEILSQNDIVLSFRNPKFPENKYNFPSKILEFFINGKIVISSINYKSIDENVYFHSEYSINSLTQILNEIKGTSDAKLYELRVKAKNFAANNFSHEVWRILVKNVENNIK